MPIQTINDYLGSNGEFLIAINRYDILGIFCCLYERRKPMRFVSILIILAVISLNGCGGGGGDAGTGTITNPANLDTGKAVTVPTITVPSVTDIIQQEMVIAVNQARAVGRSCGATYYVAASPVKWNDKIATAAFKHTTDMVTNNFYSHTGSDGTSPGDRLMAAGYAWKTSGENIAVGFSSTAEVFQAWLGSEGHCRNIMKPEFTDIGAAAADGNYNGRPSRYWTLDMGGS